MRYFHSTIVIMVMAGYLLSGCGTTHHYLPSRPLAKDEWMLSINWHYDFNGSTASLIMPEATTYVGVGNDINLGFGVQAPFFVSHFSAGKYLESGSNDYWVPYLHCNQVMGINDNPMLEFGYMYADNRGALSQNTSIGFAYGDGRYLLTGQLPTEKQAGKKWGSTFRVIPVLKYHVAGKDIGLSYTHYHGKSKALVESFQDSFTEYNDTILVLTKNDIKSVSFTEELHYERYFNRLYAIYLQDGRVCEIGEPAHPCGGVMLSNVPLLNPESRFFEQKGYTDLTIQIFPDTTLNGRDSQFVVYGAWIDTDDLTARLLSGDTIIIERYPVAAFADVRRSPFTVDHSVSVSWFPKVEK